MNNKENAKKITLEAVVFIALILALVVLEFIANRRLKFVQDDLWYMTNIVTGKPLANLADIYESQYWHFFNWGGRSVNHAVLQLVLMTGELCADILNVLVSLFLSFIVMKYVGRRSISIFLFVHAAKIAFNPTCVLNMFWESGSVNYLYSTCWIFGFLYFYVRLFEDKKYKNIYMIPIISILGIMTGWSNENMGPGAFVIATGIVAYHLIKKKKVPAWTYFGCLFSLTGSILVVVAPGNFVRGSLVQETLIQKIQNHTITLAEATMGFIFAAMLVTVILALIYRFVVDKKFDAKQIVMAIYLIIADGAMILSPMYPARATFGVMMLAILLSASFLRDIVPSITGKKKYVYYAFLGLVYIAAVTNTVIAIIDPGIG